MRLRCLLIVLLVFSNSAAAVIETYEFSNVELERRYRELSAELRCPKCQNQNIADSNAPIAQDLRQTLHQQLEAGASNEEVLEYMVQRYGEFVRYRPRFGGATTILWLTPLLLLLGAAIALSVIFRRGGTPTEEAPGDAINEIEQRRLRELLEDRERNT